MFFFKMTLLQGQRKLLLCPRCVIIYVLLICLEVLQGISAADLVLSGRGASFPNAVYQAWRTSYRSYRIANKDVTLDYMASGSGDGKRSMVEMEEGVDFAGSDSLLSQEQMEERPDLVMFPSLAGGVVMAYYLPTCSKKNGKTLNLTREHVVGIYNGTYTVWSDPSIQAVNPNCTLPNATIIVMARRTPSGTTKTFTTALSAFDENWRREKGNFSEGANENDEPYKWYPNVIKHYGPSNKDVAGLVRSFRYSVAYLSMGDAEDNEIDYAHLANRYGIFTSPTQESLRQAMDAQVNSSSLTSDIVDPDLPYAYPIAAYTYIIVYLTSMKDCEKAIELMRFSKWFMTDPKASEDADSKGFATLSTDMAAKIERDVFEKWMCRGQKVRDLLQAQINEENETEKTWILPVAITVPFFLLIVSAMAGYILYQRFKLDRMINSDEWNIPIEDIIFFFDEKMTSAGATGKSRSLRQKSIRSLHSIGEISNGNELLSQILQWPGKWRGNTVGIRLLEVTELRSLNREMKKMMLWMRDCLINANVVRFYGLTELDGGRYIIGDYCSKGTVLDIVHNNKLNLNTELKISLATEIASGMAFLHLNGIIHGLLTSSCCLLDNRWTVKISDWEFCKMFSIKHPNKNPVLALRSKGTTGDKYESVFKDFWIAPEILRSEFEEWPTHASDVYSYAIIVQEIFTRDDPYFELADHMQPEQVLQAIVHNRLRPEPSMDAPITVRQVMELAWSDIPSSRPTFEQIGKMLRRGRTTRKSIMDNMMEAMEDYTAHLEDEVEAKENAFQTIKASHETLLSQLVPTSAMASMSTGSKLSTKVYPALGVVMLELTDWPQVLKVEMVNSILEMLDSLAQAMTQLCSKYSAFQPLSQIQCSHTFFVGLEKETEPLTVRCNTVAHLALDLLQVVSNLKDPEDNKSVHFPARFSAHVGTVSAGIISITSPNFLLLGHGIDVGRALLQSAERNTVRISRSLYSQLEKNPDFELSASEAEWITCNGRDIESFVLLGRRNESGSVPSETSVDSGVEVGRNGRNKGKTNTKSGPKLAVSKPPLMARRGSLNRLQTNSNTAKTAESGLSKDDSSLGSNSSAPYRNGSVPMGAGHDASSDKAKRSKPQRPDLQQLLEKDHPPEKSFRRRSLKPSQPLSRISENSNDFGEDSSGVSDCASEISDFSHAELPIGSPNHSANSDTFEIEVHDKTSLAQHVVTIHNENEPSHEPEQASHLPANDESHKSHLQSNTDLSEIRDHQSSHTYPSDSTIQINTHEGTDDLHSTSAKHIVSNHTDSGNSTQTSKHLDVDLATSSSANSEGVIYENETKSNASRTSGIPDESNEPDASSVTPDDTDLDSTRRVMKKKKNGRPLSSWKKSSHLNKVHPS